MVCLNGDTGVGTVLGRVFAHSNAGDNCSSGGLSYGIEEESGSISVNNSGWLQLIKTIPDSFTGSISKFRITFTLCCIPFLLMHIIGHCELIISSIESNGDPHGL